MHHLHQSIGAFENEYEKKEDLYGDYDLSSSMGVLTSQIKAAEEEEQARLAALAAAQVHQQNIDNPGRAANPDDEDLGDDELLNPRRDSEVATPENRRDRQARFRPERRAMQIPFDDDDENLDGDGATGAIIPPPLAPGAKFNITSTMIQLLQLEGLFGGLAGGDSNMHLINFISTCMAFDNPGVGQNAIRLRLFPLSLSGEASDMLDRMTKQSRAWHTRGSAVASSTMDLLTKHLLSGKTKKVKAIVSQGRDESDFEEEANYLNNQEGFQGNAQGNQGRNYYDKSGNKDHDQDALKDMMAKLLKGVEATNMGVTEVVNDLSSMKQLVDSHSTAIKQLEQQMSQLSATFNQRKNSTLPSDTVQNPRNEGSCMAITTRSGKVLESPSKGKQVVDDIAENVIEADCDDSVEAENQNESVHEKTIPLPPPPFPQ
ncbi:hypothetical protein CQW23_26111 [Capsicum baccatum]|uniref:Uncharacterized protein n=1 Tax=Capsicum baccatum TaxID=33114 RepID=A0A2G2VMV5_CAPBA|nr:hypothetical protein CQW23_26111 [Capsicum baccatum]